MFFAFLKNITGEPGVREDGGQLWLLLQDRRREGEAGEKKHIPKFERLKQTSVRNS